MLDAKCIVENNAQAGLHAVDLAVPRGVASAAPIMRKYAENAELWDVGGPSRYYRFRRRIGV